MWGVCSESRSVVLLNYWRPLCRLCSTLSCLCSTPHQIRHITRSHATWTHGGRGKMWKSVIPTTTWEPANVCQISSGSRQHVLRHKAGWKVFLKTFHRLWTKLFRIHNSISENVSSLLVSGRTEYSTSCWHKHKPAHFWAAATKQTQW